MQNEESFRELMDRVRAGDDHAAAELVRIYEPHVRRAVRVRLVDPAMQQVFDSMDICQSVLANFFVRTAAGQFEIDKPTQLVALLVTMARNKLRDRVRQQHTHRLDKGREQTLNENTGELAELGHSPQRIVEARELLEQVYKRLSEEERHVARLRAGGANWTEIAQTCDSSPDALRMRHQRAVDRVADELRVDE